MLLPVKPEPPGPYAYSGACAILKVLTFVDLV